MANDRGTGSEKPSKGDQGVEEIGDKELGRVAGGLISRGGKRTEDPDQGGE